MFPPKKTIGNKDDAFIEDRRQLLQEYLINITKHNYLRESEEFSSFIRSNSITNAFADLKQQQKNLEDNTTADRAQRFEKIVANISKQNAEFRKYSKHDTKQMEKLINKTISYVNITIARFNKIEEHLKSLSIKNKR